MFQNAKVYVGANPSQQQLDILKLMGVKPSAVTVKERQFELVSVSGQKIVIARGTLNTESVENEMYSLAEFLPMEISSEKDIPPDFFQVATKWGLVLQNIPQQEKAPSLFKKIQVVGVGEDNSCLFMIECSEDDV